MNEKTFQSGAGPIAVVAPAAQGPAGDGSSYDDTFLRQRLADAEDQIQRLIQAVAELGGDMAYDDTAIKARILQAEQDIAVMKLALQALEDLPGYDDSVLKNRLNTAEATLAQVVEDLNAGEDAAGLLATRVTAVEQNIDQVELAATTLKNRVDQAEVDITAVEQSVDGVNQTLVLMGQKNTTQDQAITLLGQKDADHDTTLQALAQKNAAQDQAITTNTTDIGFLKNPAYFGHLIVPWSDSRGVQNWNANTTPVATLARGPLALVELLTQKVRLDSDYSQAVSGDGIGQLLTRIVNDTPGTYGTKKPSEVPPSIAWLQIGTNSVNSGIALGAQGQAGTMLGDLHLILDYLVSKGHKVLLLAEWPRGVSGVAEGALSADNQKLMLAYHNAILKIRRYNVWIVDVWPRVADPASVNAYLLPNMANPDNLHNSPGISMITAQEAARVIDDEMNLPRIKMTCSSNTDQYDPVLQPRGCLNVNPMLQKTVPGVAAGVLGANASGEVPAGYTLLASAGLSVVGSYVTTTLPDGSKRQTWRGTVSGTPTSTNGYFSLRQSGMIGKVALNDVLEANYEANVADGHVNFSAPGFFIDSGVAATRCHGLLSITGDNIMPTQAVRGFYGVARCHDMILNPMPASLSFELRPYFTLSGVVSNLVMDIPSASLRRK